MVNDMDECKRVQDLLADYRTGLLSGRKLAWVEGHLQRCAKCADELHALDGVLALVDAATSQREPPPGLWNGIYNRITSPEPEPLSPVDRLRQWIAKPVRAAGLGIAALALAVGLIVSNSPHETNTPMQMASSTEYVQGHALYAGQAPFADRLNYLTVVDESSGSTDYRMP